MKYCTYLFGVHFRLWKSIMKVRSKHNSASKRCSSVGIVEITQAQMAVGQFGFMGYIVSRSEEVGIYNSSDEDMEAFVHVWRVIGYIMGMEDR